MKGGARGRRRGGEGKRRGFPGINEWPQWEKGTGGGEGKEKHLSVRLATHVNSTLAPGAKHSFGLWEEKKEELPAPLRFYRKTCSSFVLGPALMTRPTYIMNEKPFPFFPPTKPPTENPASDSYRQPLLGTTRFPASSQPTLLNLPIPLPTLHPPHQLLTWILQRDPHPLLHSRNDRPHQQDALGPHHVCRLAAPNGGIICADHAFLHRGRQRIRQALRYG